MGGGVITPPYNGWYETYEFKFDDQLIKADNLNNNLSDCQGKTESGYALRFLQQGGAGADKADAKQGSSGLRVQTAQPGQRHNGNPHGKGQCLENGRDDFTNFRFFILSTPGMLSNFLAAYIRYSTGSSRLRIGGFFICMCQFSGFAFLAPIRLLIFAYQ